MGKAAKGCCQTNSIAIEMSVLHRPAMAGLVRGMDMLRANELLMMQRVERSMDS